MATFLNKGRLKKLKDKEKEKRERQVVFVKGQDGKDGKDGVDGKDGERGARGPEGKTTVIHKHEPLPEEVVTDTELNKEVKKLENELDLIKRSLETFRRRDSRNGGVTGDDRVKDFYYEVAQGRVPGVERFHQMGINGAVVNSLDWADVLDGSNFFYMSSPQRVRIKAGGNIEDDINGVGARIVRFYGVNEEGDLDFEDFETAGVNASAWSTKKWWRPRFADIQKTGGYNLLANTGRVIFENEDDLNPQIEVFLRCGTSAYAAFPVPRGKKAMIAGIQVGVEAGRSADLRVFKRENFNKPQIPATSAQQIEYFTEIIGVADLITGTPLGPYPEYTDLFFQARSTVDDTFVKATFDIFLERA